MDIQLLPDRSNIEDFFKQILAQNRPKIMRRIASDRASGDPARIMAADLMECTWEPVLRWTLENIYDPEKDLNELMAALVNVQIELVFSAIAQIGACTYNVVDHYLEDPKGFGGRLANNIAEVTSFGLGNLNKYFLAERAAELERAAQEASHERKQ